MHYMSTPALHKKQNVYDKKQNRTIGNKMGRKFEQKKRKAKWVKKFLPITTYCGFNTTTALYYTVGGLYNHAL